MPFIKFDVDKILNIHVKENFRSTRLGDSVVCCWPHCVCGICVGYSFCGMFLGVAFQLSNYIAKELRPCCFNISVVAVCVLCL